MSVSHFSPASILIKMAFVNSTLQNKNTQCLCKQTHLIALMVHCGEQMKAGCTWADEGNVLLLLLTEQAQPRLHPFQSATSPYCQL